MSSLISLLIWDLSKLSNEGYVVEPIKVGSLIKITTQAPEKEMG